MDGLVGVKIGITKVLIECFVANAWWVHAVSPKELTQKLNFF
jgi:hypothetical protein